MKRRKMLICLGLGLTVWGAGGTVRAEFKGPAVNPPGEADEMDAAVKSGSPITSALKVETIEIATGIQDRAPQGAGETFPAGVEKLYCYTKIVGGQEGDKIVHKWKKGGEVMAEVTLTVNGSPWRTHSSKVMSPEMSGDWSVEVLQGEQVLASRKFTVHAATGRPGEAKEANPENGKTESAAPAKSEE